MSPQRPVAIYRAVLATTYTTRNTCRFPRDGGNVLVFDIEKRKKLKLISLVKKKHFVLNWHDIDDFLLICK